MTMKKRLWEYRVTAKHLARPAGAETGTGPEDRVVAAAVPAANARRTSASTARKSDATQPSMTRQSVSGTRTTRDGAPEEFATKWRSGSNHAITFPRTWVDTATRPDLTVNDGVGVRMVKKSG